MTIDQLAKHFDRRAERLEQFYHSGRQSSFRQWLNRQFHSDITARFHAAMNWVRETKAQSVLDVGCGTGHYLATLADRGVPRLVGVDVSAEMLDLARRNPAVTARPGVEFVQTDFCEWASEEKFDVVIAMGYFDYQGDAARHLKKMKRHSRHSVIASFPSRHWFRTPFRWLRMRVQGTKVYFYNVHGIRDLAHGAGFRECNITILPGAGMNLIATFIT